MLLAMPKNTWVEGLVSKAGLWLLLYRYFGICTWYTRFGNAVVSRHDMVKGFHTALFNWSSNVTIPMVCPRASIGVYLTMLSVYFYLGLTFAFLPLAVDPLFFQRRVSWRAIFMCIGVYFWSQQLNICVSYSGPNGCDQRTSMFIYASTCLWTLFRT